MLGENQSKVFSAREFKNIYYVLLKFGKVIRCQKLNNFSLTREHIVSYNKAVTYSSFSGKVVKGRLQKYV